MKSEIVTTGTELLLGQITDTNSSYIASELALLGIDLFFISQVGDNKPRMLEVLKRAWERSDLIFTTGGLGPSEGDITRSAIAELVHEEMYIDPATVAQIEARFTRYGRKMSPSNVKQASVIPSCKPITNTRGTAPGWWVEKDCHLIISLPGPPGELHNMWQTEVIPRLREKFKGSIIVSRTLKTWGLSESAMNDTLLPMFTSSNPTLAIYVKPDGNQVRLTAKAETEEKARKIIAPAEEKVRALMDEAIWGADDDTMEGVVASKLKEKKLTLAVLETFTSGQLTGTILESFLAESSFTGGVMLTSPETLKTFVSRRLEDRGSSDNKFQAADAVRSFFGADIGLSVVGEPGPKDTDRPYDIISIALVCQGNRRLVTLNQPRDRIRVKRWVVSATLFELIKMLTRDDYFAPEKA